MTDDAKKRLIAAIRDNMTQTAEIMDCALKLATNVNATVLRLHEIGVQLAQSQKAILQELQADESGE